jgi:hypothetical protein
MEDKMKKIPKLAWETIAQLPWEALILIGMCLGIALCALSYFVFGGK